MHVCFKFLQPTDPNIRPYDKNLMTFLCSRGIPNIKPLAIKHVVINQKTIEVI